MAALSSTLDDKQFHLYRPNLSTKLNHSSLFEYGVVEKCIGRGTYGKVRSTDRGYALKLIKGPSTYLTTEILNEILHPPSLSHPNVIKYHDIYLLEDRIVIIMDRAIGDISRFNMIGYQKTFLDLAFQVIIGLAYINSHNIIHRDIKPQNILYYRDGPNYRYVITDFGLATGRESLIDISDFNVYTPSYRPPEITLRMNYTAKADVWALGCTLYEVYTGTRLFNNISPHEMILEIYQRLGMVNPESELYQPSIDKFGDDLTKFEKGQPLVDNTVVNHLLLEMLNPDPNSRSSIFDLQKYIGFSTFDQSKLIPTEKINKIGPMPESGREPSGKIKHNVDQSNKIYSFGRIDKVDPMPEAGHINIFSYPIDHDIWTRDLKIPVSSIQKLVDWLFDIKDDICEDNLSYHLGIEILYRYFPFFFQSEATFREYELVGLACMYLAIVWLDIDYPKITSFIKQSGTDFTKIELTREIDRILEQFKFNLSITTQEDRILQYRSIYPVPILSLALIILTYASPIPHLYFDISTPNYCINLVLKYCRCPINTDLDKLRIFRDSIKTYHQERDDIDPDLLEIFKLEF
jgi:serine/threonine protein kinase